MKRLTLVSVLAAFALAPVTSSAQTKSLQIFSWANYIAPDLLKRFETESGIKVSLDVYDSNDAMLAKLQAGGGGYDIVVPSNSILGTMIASNLLLKVDAARLQNFRNVLPPHDRPAVDPGREYSVPFLWGTTGFTYDSAKVPGGRLEESWKEFFEPRPELAGKIGVLGDMGETFTAAAHYLKIDTCTENPADAQRILDLLAKQKEAVKIYSSSGSIDRMAGGDVLMHQQWNGSAYRTRLRLATAVYVMPSEGLNLWGDNFAVPKGARNPESAKAFMDWMMDPKNAAEASNFAGYNNAIRGSAAAMKPEMQADPAINTPEALQARFRPVKDCSLKNRELRDSVWTRLRR